MATKWTWNESYQIAINGIPKSLRSGPWKTDDVLAMVHVAEDGSMHCACPDWRRNSFVAQKLDHTQPAAWCLHTLAFAAGMGLGDVVPKKRLTDLITVFDSNGFQWTNHDFQWDTEDSEIQPLTIPIFRRRSISRPGDLAVLPWTIGVRPANDTGGALWDIYWSHRVKPWSALETVRSYDPLPDDVLHVGFHEDDTLSLRDITVLLGACFQEIGMQYHCEECGEAGGVPDGLYRRVSTILTDDVTEGESTIRTDPVLRWSLIERGHFIETHEGVCPSCSMSDLVPTV